MGEVKPRPSLDQLATHVLDAALTVHRSLGPGFHESIYASALETELTAMHLNWEREYPFRVTYRNVLCGSGRVDLLVEERLVVELKAVGQLADIHKAQTLSYLKALGLPLGLLINFDGTRLMHGVKRIVNNLPEPPAA